MEAETERDRETEPGTDRQREADRGRQTEGANWLAACGLSGSAEFYRRVEYLGLEGAADLVRARSLCLTLRRCPLLTHTHTHTHTHTLSLSLCP